MPSIDFIHPDERTERIEAADGDSAMQAATGHGINEIVAECGGNAMCATCHVYVDEGWIARLAAMSARRRCAARWRRRGTARRTAACPARSRSRRNSMASSLRLPDRQI
mgnify:CR=1 FL=1